MARVLVTGGTGFLGTQLVDRLVARGHEVRSLSRHPPSSPRPNVAYVQGDVLSDVGIVEAVDGIDCVIHAASSPRRRANETEVRGNEECPRCCGSSAWGHFVYVSIVGVDRNTLPYYKAKLAAEKLVEASGSQWTIQRATQFHELLDAFLAFPLMPVTRHMAFQLVDPGEVGEQLVDLVEAGPSGRVRDFGGPEVLPVREVEAARRRISGRKGRLVPLPVVGFLRDFERGSNLCPDEARGRRTWEEWLETRYAS